MPAKKSNSKTKVASPQTPQKKSSAPLPDEIVITQLEKSLGNVSHAAKSLGMSRTALSDRIARTPALKQIVHDARQAIVDAAENALLGAVVSKQGWAVCFALKTIGRNRGYIEGQQNTNFNLDLSKLTDAQLLRFEELTKAGIDPLAAYNACLTDPN